MGLIDFFYNIKNKLKKDDIKKLPENKIIKQDVVAEVEKNAYVDAYTKRINNEKSEFTISEEGTKIKFIDSKTNKLVQIQKISKIKEQMNLDENKIDLYKAIYAFGNKENRKLQKVYFALPSGKELLDLYKGETKKASLKNKLKIMFSPSILENRKIFLGIILENEIYKDYNLVNSKKLEEYVVLLEKKKQEIKENKQKSKKQVKQAILMKDKIKKLNNSKGVNSLK